MDHLGYSIRRLLSINKEGKHSQKDFDGPVIRMSDLNTSRTDSVKSAKCAAIVKPKEKSKTPKSKKSKTAKEKKAKLLQETTNSEKETKLEEETTTTQQIEKLTEELNEIDLRRFVEDLSVLESQKLPNDDASVTHGTQNINFEDYFNVEMESFRYLFGSNQYRMKNDVKNTTPMEGSVSEDTNEENHFRVGTKKKNPINEGNVTENYDEHQDKITVKYEEHEMLELIDEILTCKSKNEEDCNREDCSSFKDLGFQIKQNNDSGNNPLINTAIKENLYTVIKENEISDIKVPKENQIGIIHNSLIEQNETFEKVFDSKENHLEITSNYTSIKHNEMNSSTNDDSKEKSFDITSNYVTIEENETSKKMSSANEALKENFVEILSKQNECLINPLEITSNHNSSVNKTQCEAKLNKQSETPKKDSSTSEDTKENNFEKETPEINLSFNKVKTTSAEQNKAIEKDSSSHDDPFKVKSSNSSIKQSKNFSNIKAHTSELSNENINTLEVTPFNNQIKESIPLLSHKNQDSLLIFNYQHSNLLHQHTEDKVQHFKIGGKNSLTVQKRSKKEIITFNTHPDGSSETLRVVKVKVTFPKVRNTFSDDGKVKQKLQVGDLLEIFKVEEDVGERLSICNDFHYKFNDQLKLEDGEDDRSKIKDQDCEGLKNTSPIEESPESSKVQYSQKEERPGNDNIEESIENNFSNLSNVNIDISKINDEDKYVLKHISELTDAHNMQEQPDKEVNDVSRVEDTIIISDENSNHEKDGENSGLASCEHSLEAKEVRTIPLEIYDDVNSDAIKNGNCIPKAEEIITEGCGGKININNGIKIDNSTSTSEETLTEDNVITDIEIASTDDVELQEDSNNTILNLFEQTSTEHQGKQLGDVHFSEKNTHVICNVPKDLKGLENSNQALEVNLDTSRDEISDGQNGSHSSTKNNIDNLKIFHHAQQVEEYVEDHGKFSNTFSVASKGKPILELENSSGDSFVASKTKPQQEESVDVLTILKHELNIEESDGNHLIIISDASKTKHNPKKSLNVLQISNHDHSDLHVLTDVLERCTKSNNKCILIINNGHVEEPFINNEDINYKEGNSNTEETKIKSDVSQCVSIKEDFILENKYNTDMLIDVSKYTEGNSEDHILKANKYSNNITPLDYDQNEVVEDVIKKRYICDVMQSNKETINEENDKYFDDLNLVKDVDAFDDKQLISDITQEISDGEEMINIHVCQDTYEDVANNTLKPHESPTSEKVEDAMNDVYKSEQEHFFVLENDVDKKQKYFSISKEDGEKIKNLWKNNQNSFTESAMKENENMTIMKHHNDPKAEKDEDENITKPEKCEQKIKAPDYVYKHNIDDMNMKIQEDDQSKNFEPNVLDDSKPNYHKHYRYSLPVEDITKTYLTSGVWSSSPEINNEKNVKFRLNRNKKQALNDKRREAELNNYTKERTNIIPKYSTQESSTCIPKRNPYQEAAKKQSSGLNQSYRKECYGRIYQEIIRNPRFKQHQDLINNFIINDVFKPQTETEPNEDFTIEEERIRKLINRSNNYKPLMGKNALLAKTRFERSDSEIVQELVTQRFSDFLSSYYQRSFQRQSSRLQKSGGDETYESLGNFQNFDEDDLYAIRSSTPTRFERSYLRESGEFVRFPLPTEDVAGTKSEEVRSSDKCANPACRPNNGCFGFAIKSVNKCCCHIEEGQNPKRLNVSHHTKEKENSYNLKGIFSRNDDVSPNCKVKRYSRFFRESVNQKSSNDVTTNIFEPAVTYEQSMRGIVDYSHDCGDSNNPTKLSSHREQQPDVKNLHRSLQESKHLNEDFGRNHEVLLNFQGAAEQENFVRKMQASKERIIPTRENVEHLQEIDNKISTQFRQDEDNRSVYKRDEIHPLSNDRLRSRDEHLGEYLEHQSKIPLSSRVERLSKQFVDKESKFYHSETESINVGRLCNLENPSNTEILASNSNLPENTQTNSYVYHQSKVELSPISKTFSSSSNKQINDAKTTMFEPSFQSTLARSTGSISTKSSKNYSENLDHSLKASESTNRLKNFVSTKVANLITRSPKSVKSKSNLVCNTSRSESRIYDQEERILDHGGSSGSTATIKDSMDLDLQFNDINLDFLLSTDEHNVETSEEFFGKKTEEDAFDDDSDKVSYDAHKFLRDALGDELKAYLSTDSQLISDLDCTGNQSIGTSNISDLLSKASSYGAIQNNQDKTTKRNSVIYEENCYSQNEYADYLSNSKKLADLILEANVQNQILAQTHKALTLCRRTKEFVASVEEIEAERIILVATLKREALKEEIQRIEYEDLTESPYKNSGCVRIKGLTFPPKPRNSFVPNLFDKRRKEFTHWFVAVLRSGASVFATKPTIPDTDGMVKFDEEFVFDHLSPDFTITVAIYVIKIKNNMRNYSHESKFHLNKNGNTLCPSPHKLFNITRDAKTKSPEETAASSSFVLGGKCVIGINNLKDLGYFKLSEMPLCSMLEGAVVINFQTSVTMTEDFSDFLNVGAETGEFITWNRRWCTLQGPYLLYYNYPEDEEPIGRLDLGYCITSYITCAERKICARPRTLLLETAAKGSSEHSPRVIKHFLAADTLQAMKVWESKLNHTVSALRNWNCMKCNFVFNKT